MDLKFLWEQAQASQRLADEIATQKDLCVIYELQLQELRKKEKDFQDLLSCVSVWSSNDGAYIDTQNAMEAQKIKEKYNV